MNNPARIEIPNYQNYCRLIPTQKANTIERGMEARVKDPLWFLTRQWQLGEFRARNGGHLARTELAISEEAITAFRRGAETAYTNLPLDNPQPLEPLVEGGEPIVNGTGVPPAWDSQRLDYRFSVKSDHAELTAREWDGGPLEWYEFSLTGQDNARSTTSVLTPPLVPAAFPGMPNRRFWSLEDYRVDLGAIERPNLNFISMLLAEFALVFSGDWFYIPLMQNTNSIRSVESLKVIDAFGITETINPMIDAASEASGFSLFTMGSGAARLLFLPRTITDIQEGEPIEEVVFQRDEEISLVWANERKWTDSSNRLRNREDEEAKNVPPQPEVGKIPLYRLKTPLPANLIPYLPKRLDLSGAMILRRGRTDEKATKDNPQFCGELLRESVTVFEEEVPAVPITLHRLPRMGFYGPEKWDLVQEGDIWKLQRAQSPQLSAWIGRRKRSSQHPVPVPLQFDYLINPDGRVE